MYARTSELIMEYKYRHSVSYFSVSSLYSPTLHEKSTICDKICRGKKMHYKCEQEGLVVLMGGVCYSKKEQQYWNIACKLSRAFFCGVNVRL